MTDHWAMKYIGKPYTRGRDCFYWFRKIQQDEFGRQCPLATVNRSLRTLTTARIMQGDIRKKFGFIQVAVPKDGDAVFLSQRSTPHHIGTVAIINGALMVIHALEGSGVVAADHIGLRQNGWNIRSFWTYAS